MARHKPTAKDAGLTPGLVEDVFAEKRFVWIFQCSKRLAIHAATLDSLGQNLPARACVGGTWNRSGQLILGPDNRESVGIDTAALRRAIMTDGFYLWNADMALMPGILKLMR